MKNRTFMCKIVMLLLLVISALCAGYGCFVRAAGSGTAFFVVWFLIAGILCCLPAVMYKGILEKLPSIVKRALIFFICFAILIFAGFQACALSHFDDEGSEELDYIIVLGAQVYSSGPSTILKYRLDKAADYLHKNETVVCIVSGGQGSNEPLPEADVMAEYIECKGISSERIIKEERSKNTAENISNSKKYITDGASVGIVTNNFHLFRALQMAERQGLKNVEGIAADSPKAYLPNNMLREFIAEIKFLAGI